MTTTIAKFTPLCVGISNLGSFNEGDIVSIQAAVQNISSTIVPAFTTALDCGIYCAGITSVTINGSAATYTVAGTTIMFPAIQTNTAVVKIVSSTPNKFSILCGNLPPGLIVSPSGLITGRLGVITPVGSATLSFTFVLRATSPTYYVADMEFTLTVIKASYTDSINTGILPAPLTDPVLNLSYIPLGTYQPSQSISYSIDIISSDGYTAALTIDNSFSVPVNQDEKFTGAPPGVEIAGTQIIGQIDANASSGLYLFQVTIAGTTVSARFGVEVIPYAGVVYAPPVTMQWATNANLGALSEGTPCFLSVVAAAYSATSPIVYSIVERLSSLPPGLSLNSSGELTGKLTYGLQNGTFSFTIRAVTGTTFIDRMFYLTVISKFTAPTIYDIGFELETQQAAAFTAPYASMIPSTALFRADDDNFGLADPRIYLLNGIDGSHDLTTVMAPEPLPAITNSSYFAPIRFLLGEHASASVSDSFGSVTYDTVYRKLYEFDTDAGGFTTGDNPTTSLVLYPQSRVSGGIYVYSVCTRNMRCKLLTTFGCATNSATAYTFGTAGGENAPLWMGGQYILAIPIAYVLPGKGKSLAADLNASTTIAPNGMEYTFNCLYCYGGVTTSLQF